MPLVRIGDRPVPRCRTSFRPTAGPGNVCPILLIYDKHLRHRFEAMA
ncbi:hypothetical protein Y88_2377 [Novosphingobium nitrogenifigens DSM 19370]|uniref:Uncharacterized protein n=1 Tax=Novosphingobium nitrogenifigens DSM 19370 TaxID=983920 RepID=F1Z6F5_9SPHN|nr:hypothetical protein Y88_2377 [Novosphingobium nitrogenifigens DSM 19370]